MDVFHVVIIFAEHGFQLCWGQRFKMYTAAYGISQAIILVFGCPLLWLLLYIITFMHDSRAGFRDKIVSRVSILFNGVYNGYVNTKSRTNKYDGKILLKIVVDKMTVISKCPVFIMVDRI